MAQGEVEGGCGWGVYFDKCALRVDLAGSVMRDAGLKCASVCLKSSCAYSNGSCWLTAAPLDCWNSHSVIIKHLTSDLAYSLPQVPPLRISPSLSVSLSFTTSFWFSLSLISILVLLYISFSMLVSFWPFTQLLFMSNSLSYFQCNCSWFLNHTYYPKEFFFFKESNLFLFNKDILNISKVALKHF